MVALLRGRRQGLEIGLAGRELDDAFAQLQARLAERPGFYQGSSAIASFGATPATAGDLGRLRDLLTEAGIVLTGVSGAAALEVPAGQAGLGFQLVDHDAPEPGELDRRRAMRPPEPRLSDNARSLVADFAGARADIAVRRKRGEASVRKLERASGPSQSAATSPSDVSVGPLYHVGTLRGGQALHREGSIIVVGDVNPGAELVATGDIVVFGRLGGVAHAGAQGDATARVYALALTPTQLRIGSLIAAESQRGAPAPSVGARAAFVRDGRIVIVAFNEPSSDAGSSKQ